MDIEGFVRWAMDGARTVDERYTTELLVEDGASAWLSRQGRHKHESLEERMERTRQRALNPAYQPCYAEESVRRAAEVLAERKHWWMTLGYQDRPLRDLSVLRWLTQLEEVRCDGTQVMDVSPLADLPRLRLLHLGSTVCEDFRPLGRCAGLRELGLTFTRPWPELKGLERLTELEALTLAGNLLALPPGVTWPKVRRAALTCKPLAARSVRELPQLPECRFLTLHGVERLEGIEVCAHLLNLKIETAVRDFGPLAALRELTCLACHDPEPLDVSPLARLPKLLCATFNTQFNTRLVPLAPRDFSVLTDAPELRELRVEGCAPVMTEVAAVNAALPPWNDLFLRAEPRPLRPLGLIAAPLEKHPHGEDFERMPDEPELIDEGVRQCERAWAARQVARAISRKLGAEDWGSTEGCGLWSSCRVVPVEIQAFAVVERLPEIVEAVRECLARFRHDFMAHLTIELKAPRPEPTAAQKKLEEKLEREQEEADWEEHERERAEYLERLHRYELKKQEGGKVNPAEFAPDQSQPLPPPPWEDDEDEGFENEGEDEAEDDSGDVKVMEDPDPPPIWDDEHPLAGQYRFYSHLTHSELWVCPQNQSLAEYLMGRGMDKVIPEKPAA